MNALRSVKNSSVSISNSDECLCNGNCMCQIWNKSAKFSVVDFRRLSPFCKDFRPNFLTLSFEQFVIQLQTPSCRSFIIINRFYFFYFFFVCSRLFTEEYVTITCTRDSGKFIFSATSSRMNISGYLVFWNNDSMTSNWARVNVVRSLLCFLGLPGAYGDTEKRGKYTFKYCKMTFRLFRKCKIHAFTLKNGNVWVRCPMCGLFFLNLISFLFTR